MLYDKDIREPLFDFMEARYNKIRFIEEKRMGKSRADIVMVMPDSVIGIEIKSDADTYARLKNQVKDYDKYFDKNFIVVGSTHGAHIDKHVPSWWGIITVEKVGSFIDFYVLREACSNAKIDIKRKLSMLWRPELVHIQCLNHMPKYKEKSKAFVIDKILHTVPADRLAKQISDALFERDYTTIEAEIQAYKNRK